MLSVSVSVSLGDDLDILLRNLKQLKFCDEKSLLAMDFSGKNLHRLRRKLAGLGFEITPIKKPSVVEEVREFQVKSAKGEWVLILDYDEYLPDPLRREIRRVTSNRKNQSASAFAVRRINYSLGRKLTFGGWGDDYQIRLIRKEVFIKWPRTIHSTPHFQGGLRKLKHPLHHFKDPSLEYIVSKTNRYSDEESRIFLEGGVARVNSFTLIRKLCMEIFRRGVLKAGFLDGPIGLIQTIYQGFSVFISYAKLFELQLPNSEDKQHA